MSYVPSHLEYLSRSGTRDGWPPFVTEEGKAESVRRVKEALAQYGQITLGTAEYVIFNPEVKGLPEEFKQGKVALWDARLAVAHRALLAADAEQVWVGKKTY